MITLALPPQLARAATAPAALFISDKTVSVHVSNLLGKLGAANRAEAALIGDRLGLVASTDPA